VCRIVWWQESDATGHGEMVAAHAGSCDDTLLVELQPEDPPMPASLDGKSEPGAGLAAEGIAHFEVTADAGAGLIDRAAAVDAHLAAKGDAGAVAARIGPRSEVRFPRHLHDGKAESLQALGLIAFKKDVGQAELAIADAASSTTLTVVNRFV
jgi:hypothetical protein